MGDVLIVKAPRFCRPHQAPVLGVGGRQYHFPKVRGVSACMVDERDALTLLGQRHPMPGGSMVSVYRKATAAELARYQASH